MDLAVVVTTVRPATAADLPAIEALRRADGDALGFVPQQRYVHIVQQTLDRGRSRFRYEWLLVALDNGEVTGFVLASFGRHGAKLEQVCVRRDARRMERALRLVDTVLVEATRRHLPAARCRVAADLEANLFWRAAGWTPVTVQAATWLNTRAAKTARPLVRYEIALCQARLFPLATGAPHAG